nr:PDDEXK nuclease domain-containing protein [Fibrobacter sp. UWT3]
MAGRNTTCFSPTNLLYMKNFYLLYQSFVEFTPQVGEQLYQVPWGHHKLLIDKFKQVPQKALFFVQQTVEKGWSRSTLLNMLSTDLYERHGKALTNFQRTLPAETSELAQELTKDPYDFAFTGITGRHNEKLLKDKLLDNITKFLVELGTGFAYVGRELSQAHSQSVFQNTN